MQQAACGSVEQGRQCFVENLFRRQTAGIQVGETARKQVFAGGRQQPFVQHAPDALGAVLPIRHVGGQELQDGHDVGHILFVLLAHGIDAAAHEDPQRLFDVERAQARFLFPVQPLLLEERQQAGGEVGPHPFLVAIVLQVEDVIVLAETVAVEPAVGIVEQRAARVEVGQIAVPGHGLTEGGRIFEGEALFTKGVAELHPGPVAASRSTTMSFIDEDKVVALECIHRHRLLAHLLLQLGDLQDLHRTAGEQAASVLVEDLCLDARLLEFAQVLLRQPFLGREQDDPVQLARKTMRFQEPLVLEDVGMHEQRLAAAGGHPEGDLVELEARVLGLLQCRDPVRFRERLVQRRNARVERLPQAGGVAEVAVEVDFREQQRQVLEVLPGDRLLTPGDAPVVEVLRDRNDGLVVLQQLLVRQLRPVLRGQVQAKGVVEAVDVVRIQSFQGLILQMGGELVETLDPEQTEQPLVEGELAVERQRRAGRGGPAARSRPGRSCIVLARTSARHQAASFRLSLIG